MLSAVEIEGLVRSRAVFTQPSPRRVYSYLLNCVTLTDTFGLEIAERFLLSSLKYEKMLCGAHILHLGEFEVLKAII